ncbi:unnamed protein product [Chironomus riparius]|uniref:Uncharacterized protein n=1 Tax=Chironomus riparius TaxID=315576 RepID=A0A9P0N8U0_9DIPT|nr:unnamed protein product [Chironomus riparius]
MMDNIISIFIVLLNLILSFGQKLSCTYANNEEFEYSCYMTIQNPDGLNNFTDISGEHLAGRSDYDVQNIIRTISSKSINVPSIICNKFQNTKTFAFGSIGVERVDENTFDGCKELTRLWLYDNKISYLPKNIFDPLVNLEDLAISNNKISSISIEWFTNLVNLEVLYLHNNQIEDIPKKVFRSLKQLSKLYLTSNNLKVIHSESFGMLPNLKEIYIYINQINAIDERMIDLTGVEIIDMNDNVCASGRIIDDSATRQSMRNALQRCFDNYKALFPDHNKSNCNIISNHKWRVKSTKRMF